MIFLVISSETKQPIKSFVANKGVANIGKILKSSIFLVILVIFVLPIFRAGTADLKLNQFFIASRAIHSNSFSISEIAKAFTSYYSFGINNILYRQSPLPIDYKDPKKLLGYLWPRFPAYAIVYPTETYYYYSLKIGGEDFAGNIRLLDLKEGVLHIGYYDKKFPIGDSNLWFADMSKVDGIKIKVISDFRYEVSYEGRTVTFVLSDFINQLPKKPELNENEKFISQIFDESGVRLVLIFNSAAETFYFLVNQDIPLNDNLKNIGDDFYYGLNTGFVYYKSPQTNRLTLVGVNRRNISANNYFDGPFDQVPPRLPIREELLMAFPSLKTDPNRTIDEYGNYKSDPNRRVAISAYFKYLDLASAKIYLKNKCENKIDNDISSCLTKRIR